MSSTSGYTNVAATALSTTSAASTVAPKIVFACKSNTCRSQMAEGWAKEWIRTRMAAKYGHVSVEPDSSVDYSQLSSSSPHLSLVASAALVDTSVFQERAKRSPSPGSSSSCTDCYGGGDTCEMNLLQRKSVKAKAIEIMAKHGVDISSHLPKQLDEVLPPPSSEDDDLSSNATQVEKLIILCSCGSAAAKEDLNRRAKSVEEWNVDAPTAAENAGEADAFLRVSLEIKRCVDNLMQDMFGEEFAV